MRVRRGVKGLFQHDLIEINGDMAIFKLPDGTTVQKRFDLLHATPKMGPHQFVAVSPIANDAGYVDVDQHTLRHKKYPNVWAIGDASSLPTSKTAAAITSQAPVLVSNLLQVIQGEQELKGAYDGYTSCPLLTSYGKVMLAEFKYGGEVKETFSKFGIDQGVPRRVFYHLKKDFFPWVYYRAMVKGKWAGPDGFVR
jgi:sulfide:quinone oxidoreductase